MASTIADLLAKLSLDNTAFSKGIDASIKQTGGLEKSFAKVQQAGMMATGAMAGFAGAVVGGIAAVGGLATKLAIDAAPIENVRAAFDGLTESAGSSGTVMLNALKEGSYGMVSQADAMKSYNKAAQLVSLDFANKLPDAMQYLTKVAASTGQGMDYMLDSMVTGVGRLSPMILDNLGIQVNITEASEAWAKANNRTVESMSKAEQQTAMMDMVLEKLATNTANMPDVTESAAVKWEAFKATMTDNKDLIGQQFLPMLSSLMDTFGTISENVMPLLMDALDSVVPFFENLVEVGGNLVTALFDAGVNSTEFREALTQIIPEETVTAIYDFVGGIQSFIDKAIEILEPITNWVTENIKLQDVLTGLAIVIATFVVPAVWSLLSPILATIAIIALVIAIVALLRLAWENDFLGIATFLTDLWENSLKPAFESLKEWLEINIPIAVEKLSTFWKNTLKPALEVVWAFIQDKVIPIFKTLVDFWAGSVSTTLQHLANLWNNTLKPALEAVWSFLQDHVFPLFESLVELFNVGFQLAILLISDLWNTTLKPAFKAVGDYLSKTFQPIIEKLREWFADKLAPAGETVKTIMDNFGAALDSVKGFIDGLIDKVRALIDIFGKVKTPPALTPGSPTPFEMGLRGIAGAMDDLNKKYLPEFQAKINFDNTEVPAFNSELMEGLEGGAGAGNVKQYYLTANYKHEDELTLTDRVRMLNALAGA